MFAALISRAQTAVDTAIGQFVNRAIIAVPFLIAGGFATASIYMRLDRSYGAETATLVMAGAFAALGLITLALVGRTSPPVAAGVQDASESVGQSSEAEAPPSAISETDKELLFAALASAAPVALPGLLRLALRNIPILIAIVAALFVMTRPAQDPAAANADAAPASA